MFFLLKNEPSAYAAGAFLLFWIRLPFSVHQRADAAAARQEADQLSQAAVAASALAVQAANTKAATMRDALIEAERLHLADRGIRCGIG